MKFIMKRKPIEVLEGIIVKDENCGILCEKENLKQSLKYDIKEKRYVLIEDSIENTNNYNSNGHIEVFCNEGDIIIGDKEKGFTKPIAGFVEIDEEAEKAINKINSIL